ncbi:MAG: endonuclease/exonuclease/phosphatase family protein [Candidatus Cloacimonetes bacterium]|nr:endonuclease/exonuclease/phosphatase family protein [Candidatus Cloacimonadota bacterium]
MKKLMVLFCCLWALVLVAGDIPAVQYDTLAFGDDASLEIMTWNLEHFPKHGAETIQYAANVIFAVQPDIVALQEIESDSAFTALVAQIQVLDRMHTWAGFRSNTNSWKQNLAYIYKSSEVFVTGIYQIYADDELYHAPFPRKPLLMKARYHDTDLVLINNHYKAMSGEKNEVRRRQASQLLAEYIHTNLPHDNVLLMGDLNDILTDVPEKNVFSPFLDAPDQYRFADFAIAADSTANWSYPYWKHRGHIDHILISNELFDEADNPGSEVRTVVIDDVMEGGENARYKYITDHRPVVLKLAIP